jgi:hypothetical protein
VKPVSYRRLNPEAQQSGAEQAKLLEPGSNRRACSAPQPRCRGGEDGENTELQEGPVALGRWWGSIAARTEQRISSN